MMVSGPERGVIGPHGLPSHISRSSSVTSRATLADARREFEERYVRAALARSAAVSAWNVLRFDPGAVLLALRQVPTATPTSYDAWS